MMDPYPHIAPNPTMSDEYLKTEVLKNIELIQRRKDNLYLALILGTNYNKMVRLNAHTVSGAKLVEGVILAITDEYVILKGGQKVPVCCIEDVRIY
ncbi:MAG: hypothetical protein NZM35_02565 [Chitinophagales bacterium]|nr:hypothetical protein [Chitinophagales bacterium]MDW8419802.1 hypothetical protein [Chitinophagales bacterium]